MIIKMMFYKNTRFDSISLLTIFLLTIGFLLVPFTTSCSAGVTQMSEEQAAQVLRVLTKEGKLPSENAVLDIENRFAKTKTGALAKLLRARIRYETNDFNGAAQILDSNVFREKTTLPDYALWLRGKSLQQTGNHAAAMNAFAELARDFPNSLKAREAKILWATSAMQSGQAAQVPNFLSDLNDKGGCRRASHDCQILRTAAQPTAGDKLLPQSYFYGAGMQASREAETRLNALGQSLAPQTAEEIKTRADKFYDAKNWTEAANAYTNLLTRFSERQFAANKFKTFNGIFERQKNAGSEQRFQFDSAIGDRKSRKLLSTRARLCQRPTLGTGADGRRKKCGRSFLPMNGRRRL
jgi:outer membrane protein assembly factor BamD (BamD/ComL family)